MKFRYIVTEHPYRRHDTCALAVAEKHRLQEKHPEKNFRVLTVIDEPNKVAMERDNENSGSL